MAEQSTSVSNIICEKCNENIVDFDFKACLYCDKLKHNLCLSSNEERSFDSEAKRIICDNCLYNLATQSLNDSKNKSLNVKNEITSSDSDSNCNTDDSDSDDNCNSAKPDNRNVTVKRTQDSTVDYLNKLSLKRLPVVVDDNLSWCVFYDAFKETKHLFSHIENVTRIQEAIKDERVKKIGELSIRNESFLNTNTRRDKEVNEMQRFEKSRMYHTSESRSEHFKSKQKCWFHECDSHPFNKCKDLWRMNGKDVTALAKKNGICTYCGREWLTHKNCPNDKLKCKVEGCSLPHHSLFCFKRKADVEFSCDESHSKNQNNDKNQTPEQPGCSKDKNEDEMDAFMQELSNSQFYTNNFQRSNMIFSDYSTLTNNEHRFMSHNNNLVEAGTMKPNYSRTTASNSIMMMDTGTQTLTTPENEKTFIDASTQTSFEILTYSKSESKNVESKNDSPNILYESVQNKSDSINCLIQDLTFDSLSTEVKNDTNVKSASKKLRKKKDVVKHQIKSKNPNEMKRRMMTNYVPKVPGQKRENKHQNLQIK
ncbi:uncharacterized protein [Chironomus tepperi]|uniref:uncharacterized protein n=1 Tax=Chironomus tepperi TaxID=113505 RepID=UPI00391FC1D2